MPTYCPPVEDRVPPVYLAPDRFFPVPRLAQRLFRHYKNRAGARNIYILNDGSVTLDQPWDQSTIATTVFGGHRNEVTQADYDRLVNAGYLSSC